MVTCAARETLNPRPRYSLLPSYKGDLMKSLFLTAVLLLAATSYAHDGAATLDFGTFYSNYTVDLDGDKLNGNQENLGYGSGEVALERVDGNWEGAFGFNRITSRKFDRRSETRSSYEFTVLPGGYYVANIERKLDRKGNMKTTVNLSYATGEVARATLKDGKYLEGNNSVVSVSLNKKNDTTWSGTTSVTLGRGIETADTELTADGALNPETLITTDPQLFVILYVLPYNYSR